MKFVAVMKEYKNGHNTKKTTLCLKKKQVKQEKVHLKTCVFFSVKDNPKPECISSEFCKILEDI